MLRVYCRMMSETARRDRGSHVGAATWLAGAALAAVVIVLAARTVALSGDPQVADPEHWGMGDFRDNSYYPVVALRDGRNPYDRASYKAHYPVHYPFPPYSPLALLLYLPFGFLPYDLSRWLYFAATVGLTGALAWTALRMSALRSTPARVLGLAAFLLASRPGHWNLVLGQCAVTLALATYLALAEGRRRPWLGGLGLALAAIKPTFALPLGVLLLADGAWAAVVRGMLLAGLGMALVVVPLVRSAGGPVALVAAMVDNAAWFAAKPDVVAGGGTFRVDLASTVARWLDTPLPAAVETALAVAVLGLGAAAVYRLAAAREDQARVLAASVACATMVSFSYHQNYDLLLLTLPLVATIGGVLQLPATGWDGRRVLLPAALTVPFLNYLASGTAQALTGITVGSTSWRLLMSATGGAVLLAFAMLVVATFRWQRSSPA